MDQPLGLIKRLWRQIRVRYDQDMVDRWNQRQTNSLVSDNRNDSLFSYIVVTPHLVHLAPLATLNSENFVQPVFVLNGVSQTDVEWLFHFCPKVPTLRYTLSFMQGGSNILSHGRIIKTLADVHQATNFCIQDADCFVTSSDLWEAMTLDAKKDSAAGPFLQTDNDPPYPETPLLNLNGKLISQLSRTYGVDVRLSWEASRKVSRILLEAGYPPGRFLEPKKDYFDALHQYWIVARHLGFDFHHVEGAHEKVFHIGGTSYLFDRFDELEKAEYWPINAQYFHLRLLELPACSRFTERFTKLKAFHKDSDTILKNYPEYARGWRRQLSDKVLNALDVGQFYS